MSITFYNAALVLHIVGITLMAGTAFIDFITFRAFSKTYTMDMTKAMVLENHLYKLQRFLGIGMLLILISGITMMAKLHDVWGAQLWFRIKMGVLLLVIINGLGLRRVLGKKLQKMTTGQSNIAVTDERWNSMKRKFTAVQLIQIMLFVIIYTLSVFKFN